MGNTPHATATCCSSSLHIHSSSYNTHQSSASRLLHGEFGSYAGLARFWYCKKPNILIPIITGWYLLRNRPHRVCLNILDVPDMVLDAWVSWLQVVIDNSRMCSS